MDLQALKQEITEDLLNELDKKMDMLIAKGLGEEEVPDAEVSVEVETGNEDKGEGDLDMEEQQHGASYSEVGRNGAEPGSDPAKVSSEPMHEKGNSQMQEVKEELGAGAGETADSLRDFLKGKSSSKPSSESATVSLIGMKPKAAANPMPSFMKKGGKGKKK